MDRTIYSDETIHTWELFPQMIQWHQFHRQYVDVDLSGNPRVHINALLIMCSAVMVEGAVSSLLLFYVNVPGSPFRSAITVREPITLFNERNRELLTKRIRVATWRDYKQLFQTITGLSLPELVHASWESVKRLFDFRNILSHGEQLQIKGEWKPEEGLELLDVERSKNKLFNYLERNSLIEKPKFGESLGWSFLSDEIADHFVSAARNFLDLLSENVPDTQFEETIPKRIKEVLVLSKPPDSTFKVPLYTAKKDV